MSENVSILGNERSFFEDNTFYNNEAQKNNKEISKNSSNAEGTYDKLNNEIKKFTENPKDSSYVSSNSNSKTFEKHSINDHLLERKYWDKQGTQTEQQFTNKFEKLKKLSEKIKIRKQIPKPNQDKIFEYTSDIDEFDSDELSNDDNDIINKVSSIHIQSTKFNTEQNKINNNNYDNRYICITEPEEFSYPKQIVNSFNNENIQDIFFCPIPRIPIGSFVSMNYPTLNKGSFVSTNYSSTNNKVPLNFGSTDASQNLDNDENSDNIEVNQNINFNKHLNDFRNRINNNNEYDMNYNNIQKMNLNLVYCPSLMPNQLQNMIQNQNNSNNNIGQNKNNNKEQISINSNLNNNVNNINNINNTNNANTNNNKAIFFNQNSNTFFHNNTNGTNNNNTNKQVKNIHHKVESLKGEKQLINIDDIINGKDKRTTVMIRNIPIKYSDKMLIEELNNFKGKFDCIYVPHDYEKGGNKGYGFINFVHPFHILLFHDKFQNKTWTHFESKKICELNSANFQGINEIQKHAKNYKGLKKPTFFKGFENLKNLEVPLKYLSKIKKKYPKLSYVEKKESDLFVIKSFGY